MTNPTAALDPQPHQDLRAYCDWSRRVWKMAPTQDPRPASDTLVVIGFGLAGETGEALEFFELGDPEPQDMEDLAKEMGDVFYYWACLCWYTGVDPIACWQSALGPDQTLPRDIDQAAGALAAGAPQGSIERLGLMLSSRNGLVLEQLKKSVRDGTFDGPRLVASLGQQAQVWCAMLAALDLKPSHVLGITVAKVEDRISRGTLLGSGNHR